MSKAQKTYCLFLMILLSLCVICAMSVGSGFFMENGSLVTIWEQL